jgi:hypothetical protein
MPTDRNQIQTTTSALRPYRKPTLARGPVLANVTATIVSGQTMNECWVARAAFGEHDIRWMIFRAWLLEDAPAWFRAAYLRHGPVVATKIESRDRIRALVRTLMMGPIRRKLGLA